MSISSDVCDVKCIGIGGKQPFTHLVYPCPDHATGALGVHSTLDMSGCVKFGPDAVWIPSFADEYAGVDEGEARLRHFETSIRRYFPSLTDNCLQPDYAGIRPKLVGPNGQSAALDKWGRDLTDFVIEGPLQHGGARGLVNLYGIESPGLTCSLRIGEHVAGLVFAAEDS
jgi:L-2-hydroxyglutarate oxidase LhgO